MSECIEWTGATTYEGYGQRWYKGASHPAHRVVFFETHGYWPNVCRHTCDNPPCVNRDHLVDGTQVDNMRDMKDKGRWASSIKRLTDEEVRTIRKLYSIGSRTQKSIADQLGTSRGVVRGVLSHRTYVNVL